MNIASQMNPALILTRFFEENTFCFSDSLQLESIYSLRCFQLKIFIQISSFPRLL